MKEMGETLLIYFAAVISSVLIDNIKIYFGLLIGVMRVRNVVR